MNAATMSAAAVGFRLVRIFLFSFANPPPGSCDRAIFRPALREDQMIKIDNISDSALRITAPEKLKADDFRQIGPQVDSIISRYGKIRLLIDASGFNGWENIAAFENHAGFVKNHQQKVDRIAAIVAHDWQRWLIGAVRVFLHPEIRAYDKDHETVALQ
jgi:hypothetical protein